MSTNMKVLCFFFIELFFCFSHCESSGLLRATHEETVSKNEQRDRELTFYVGGKEFSGNSWYTNYKPGQIPYNWNKGDSPDYYRKTDKCYKNGTIKRSNCPTPPNCNFTGKLGKGKLCINRLPTPEGKWYVAAIGCIPHFENCDKCMCGKMQGTGKSAHCKLNLSMDPDDDAVNVNCYDLTKFTMDGHSVHVGRSPRT